jgi:hypothetical protein
MDGAMIIPDKLISDLKNLPCCRIDIRNDKTMFIGLGEKCIKKNRLSLVEYYGEWELGTYNASWRILENNKILIGSYDENNNQNINNIIDERFLDIVPLSDFDVRVKFSNGLLVDFFNCSHEDDEALHVLHINGNYWELNCKGLWTYGHSDLPSYSAHGYTPLV